MTQYRHEPTNKTITQGKNFLDENGRRHTDKWADWSDEMKASFGIVVVEPMINSPRPEVDGRFYRTYQGTPVDNTQVWETVPKDVDVIKTALLAEIDSIEQRIRYESEIVVGGVNIPTNMDTLTLLSHANRKPKALRKMKIGKVRMVIDSATTDAIDTAIDTHHEQAGDNAYDLAEAVEAATTFEELVLIDIDAGWPEVYVAPVEPLI